MNDPLSKNPVKAILPLRGSDCSYHKFSELTTLDFSSLVPTDIPMKCDFIPPGPLGQPQIDIFDGFGWTRWSSQNWHIPVIATVLYLILIPLIKRFMATRDRFSLRWVVMGWNFLLSAFSFAGMFYTVPQLLFGETAGLFTKGLYPSICAHASSYGFGMPGFFVALFIYSKIAELVDTLWLLLRKSPVILLQWYHHFTVLLYCWHSYSSRIGTGLYFASMNYSVHSVMYFYYGLTQCGPGARRFSKKFARFITTIQLAQMVIGIGVTVGSMVYHARGDVCYVSLVNSVLGLLMYTSYFALFLQLYLANYVYNKTKASEATAEGKHLQSRTSRAKAS